MANEDKILALLEQIASDVSEMKVRMGSMEARMDSIETRMDRMEARMDSMEARMDRIEARMDSIEARMDKMETRMDKMEADISGVKSRMDKMEADISGIKVRLDVDVDRNFKLLAEGHEMLQEHIERTTAPMDRVERIEGDVIVLKSATKDLNQRVSVLETAR